MSMSVSQHYTTVVIGCGPAGTMAARQAARKGPVLMVESMKLPRQKSCGGMLNEYSQAFIKEQLNERIPADIFSSPEWIKFRFFDWDRDIRKPTSLTFANVDRAGFDEWLMHFLPDNVEIVDNMRLTYASQKRDEVTVQLRQADDLDAEVVTVTCEYLIGADGPMTTTRTFLPVPQLQHYKTIQEYLPLTDELEAYFDCLYARGIGEDYGYGYLIPKGNEAVLGSVFFPHSKGVGKLHEKAKMLYSSFYPFETEGTKKEAWSAIQVRNMGDIAGGHGRILLAGEAAGLFSPSSGEGISFAMNSGTLAGVAIARAHEGSTVLGKRDYLTTEESDALRIYRASLEPIKKNIQRRLRMFPVLNSDWGKFIGGTVPNFMVDYTAHII